MESACQSFEMLLSAYADGEVSARERSQVELHLSGCADCRTRLADLKALSQVVSARLEQEAQQADFSRFADRVMQRIEPRPPPLLERLRVAWGEIMAYHRTAVISSLATAAVTIAVAVPLAYKLALSQQPEVIVKNLEIDDPSVQPVVMQMGDGRMLIMLVPRSEADGEDKTIDLSEPPPTGGDL